MTIRHWPEEDRPREKLLTHGVEMLTDAELLAVFLQTGTPGKSALDLAKELLQEMGDLKKLLQTPPCIFLKKNGIGKAKYAAIKAALELGRRSLHVSLRKRIQLHTTPLAQSFFASKLMGRTNEVFACAFLDVKLRLLAWEILFQGTIDEINIYPREIVRHGFSHNAAKIIIAHNHPSGCCEPSLADKKLTFRLKEILESMQMILIDHIIIGDTKHFSFAAAGWL